MPLALLAGAGALIQVLRIAAGLSFEFGATIEVQATVFGCFIGGAALGTLLVGARSDASTRPLRWCGLLQLGLAIYALALPTLRDLVGDNPGMLVTALALAGLPGLLTGATIAVLTRAAAHTTDRAAAATGVILGSMALGGAGAIVIGGVLGSLAAMLGGVVHAVVGAAAWGLSSRVGAREVFSSSSAGAVTANVRAPWTGGGGVAGIAALVGLGIVVPLQRFAWQRVIAVDGEYFLLSLAGLGLGWCAGAMLVDAGSNARRVLARALLGAAVLTLAPLLFAQNMLRSQVGMAAALALVVPGAFGVGLALPLVLRARLSDRESVGRQSGTLIFIFAAAWAFSLLALVGPLLGSFAPGGMIFLSAVLLVIVGTWNGFGRGVREWIPASAATLATVLVLLVGGLSLGSSANAGLQASGSDARPRTVAVRMTPSTTYRVVENLSNAERTLYRNGVADTPADCAVEGRRFIAHLPLLLHGKPERVLVGSFGSGAVAGAVAVHAEVQAVDVIDNEEAVFELAAELTHQNRKVLDQDKVTAAAGPLRHIVRTRRNAYDVVVFEPRQVSSESAGAAFHGVLFYTSQFYALMHDALRAGGMLCQRLPARELNLESVQSAVAAACSAFPHVSIWESADGLFLLAARGQPKLERDAFLVRVSKVARDLQAARLGDPSHLLAAYVCSGARFAGEVAPLTDGDRVEAIGAAHQEWRALVASMGSKEGPPWAADLYDSLPAAAQRTARLRETLATADAASADLYAIADGAREDLRARAAAEECLYRELMAKNDWASAARLTLVRDRRVALRQMSASMEDADRRRFYEILLLREGGVPEEAALARLSQELGGGEALYVRNRLHALRGQALEPGEEKVPSVALRDPTEALRLGQEEELRELLLDAECAGLMADFDTAAWSWWKEQTEKASAVVMLHNAGWRQSLRAARQVAGREMAADLVMLAPVLAAAYPADSTWARVCQDRRAEVRVAAAEAARANGTRAHVDALIELCRDPSQEVRTGAYHSLQGIVGEAVEKTGYDPADPSAESMERLEALHGTAKQPAAPGK